MKTVWYCVDDSDPCNGHTLKTLDRPPYYWDVIANECADDYHNNHDGWESTWPLRFFLRETEDGPIVAVFDVDREVVPQFSAMKVPITPQEDAT